MSKTILHLIFPWLSFLTAWSGKQNTPVDSSVVVPTSASLRGLTSAFRRLSAKRHLALDASGVYGPFFRRAAVRRQLANILLREAYDSATIFYAIRVAEFLHILGVSILWWFLLAG